MNIEVNSENAWRVKTPGSGQWPRSPRAGQPNKYFMVSCDTHLSPPRDLFAERIEKKFVDRLAKITTDESGKQFLVAEGARPAPLLRTELFGEDQHRQELGKGPKSEDEVDAQLRQRIDEQAMDGVDAELLFPNGPALTAFWTPDPEFAQAQFRVYNDWAAEATKPYRDKLNVAACISTADIDSAVAEIERVTALGYRVVTLPTKPIVGNSDVSHINYNLPVFDPLWAALRHAGLAITFHISTGRDPRTARGAGGAVINYAVHGIPTVMEPIANLCSSGVLERFPELRIAGIECGSGWLPWFLDTMDEGYRKHHHWARPKLKALPSDYFRANWAVTFGEDRPGMALVEEYNLVGNMLWANDYPHHEGTWPHSAEAIERNMGHLRDDSRAKMLGLNAARMFNFDIPEQYRAA